MDIVPETQQPNVLHSCNPPQIIFIDQLITNLSNGIDNPIQEEHIIRCIVKGILFMEGTVLTGNTTDLKIIASMISTITRGIFTTKVADYMANNLYDRPTSLLTLSKLAQEQLKLPEHERKSDIPEYFDKQATLDKKYIPQALNFLLLENTKDSVRAAGIIVSTMKDFFFTQGPTDLDPNLMTDISKYPALPIMLTNGLRHCRYDLTKDAWILYTLKANETIASWKTELTLKQEMPYERIAEIFPDDPEAMTNVIAPASELTHRTNPLQQVYGSTIDAFIKVATSLVETIADPGTVRFTSNICHTDVWYYKVNYKSIRNTLPIPRPPPPTLYANLKYHVYGYVYKGIIHQSESVLMCISGWLDAITSDPFYGETSIRLFADIAVLTKDKHATAHKENPYKYLLNDKITAD